MSEINLVFTISPKKVNFTTTLFALIRENLKINVRESSEMDQADIELRTTIIKCWPHTKRDKIDLLVPTPKSKMQQNQNDEFF